MRSRSAAVAFGIAHAVMSFVAFSLAVVGAEGLAMGGSPKGLLFYVWQVLAFVLGAPIVTGVLALYPTFPWKTGWVFLPFVLNSSLWVWMLWRIAPAIRRRLAGAA
jgi:hypothetical protein